MLLISDLNGRRDANSLRSRKANRFPLIDSTKQKYRSKAAIGSVVMGHFLTARTSLLKDSAISRRLRS